GNADGDHDADHTIMPGDQSNHGSMNGTTTDHHQSQTMKPAASPHKLPQTGATATGLGLGLLLSTAGAALGLKKKKH
ncbi:MAG: LPXTG cell wall anchor domain-containing protein, partial [Aerococcus sp.]|nr:LPXTG cell wall anchor domain-containing protein [Aerococcus sp.]